MTPRECRGATPDGHPTSVRGADRAPAPPAPVERTASGVVVTSGLRVVLDDELLGEDRVDLGPRRHLVDEDLQAARDDLHPGRDRAVAEGLARQLEREGLDGLLADRDDVVLLDPVARDVDAHAVDQEVAVAHELARLATGAGQARAVDDVVETGLEDRQDVLTGLAGAVGRLLVVPAELLLHDAVGEAGLLLLLQLGEVLLLLDPATPVLAGREGTQVEVLVAADEVGLEPARLLGDGSGVTGHVSLLTFREVWVRAQTRRRLGGRTPLCGLGVTSWIEPTSRPAAVRERMAVSRPDPGPLTKTSTLRIPCSMARRAAASAAVCAAYGVDLRDPLKPTWPAEAQAMTAPVGSVIEMIVLLNVLLMWAWPTATFFFSLRRTFLAPAVRPLGGMCSLSYEFFGSGGSDAREAQVTCRPSSCRPRCAWDPCGCARWSWCADRAPGGHVGDAGPRRTRSPPCGGCPTAPRGAGLPRP